MRPTTAGKAICVLVVLLCASCGPTSKEDKSDTAAGPATAILGAFDKEVTLLEDQLTEKAEHEIEGLRFVSGRLRGRSVVVAWTGIGKVNAAMTTTLVIEHFKPSEVIFTGIAGAVNPELRPGDIVIAQKVAYHDMGTVWPEGLFFKGVKNRLTGIENPVFFPADKELVKSAGRASETADLEAIRIGQDDRRPKIIKGVVVTGDVFVASPDKCKELRERLEADAVEMEGAAVAQLCFQRNIPYLVIRSISDSADEGAVFDKQMFYIMAARNSSTLVCELVGLLAESESQIGDK